MPVVNIHINDLKQVFGKDLDKKRDAALKAIRTSVKEHGPRIAMEVVEASQPKPVDRGTYRRSWRADDLPTGVSFYNYAPHAGVIEDGRRPGSRMPPVDVIEAWLRRKLRVAIKEGRHEKMTPGAWRAAAWAVARAIARRGLPAHRVLAKVNARLRPLVEQAVRRALGGAP